MEHKVMDWTAQSSNLNIIEAVSDHLDRVSKESNIQRRSLNGPQEIWGTIPERVLKVMTRQLV